MKKYFFVFAVIVFSLSSGAETLNPSIVVHLLDYLAKDYSGAVQDGKVISESEYSEQKEFAAIVQKSASAIDAFKKDSAFESGITELVKKIESKAEPTDVSKTARELQAKAISLAGIEIAPVEWPKLSEGKALFQKNCTSCHGDLGKGDGLAGAALDPKPANFWEVSRKKESSPYQYFNTIRLGVPGTGMAPWPNFSDKDTWDLAFYVKSLGMNQVVSEKPTLDLKNVASLKDEEIIALLPGSENDKYRELIQIRTFEPRDLTSTNFLATAKTHIDESMTSYRSGNFEQATSLALKSYLEGIEPIEAKIRANDPDLVTKIETEMASFRTYLTAGSVKTETEAKYQEILSTFGEINAVIAEKKMSPSLAFSAAFAIFLREGFEAVLIIITLLSVIKTFNATRAAHWVHAGWGTALGLGVLTWFASGFVISMSGASRELTEGWVSLFAVVVLLYVGFWLHRQTEIGRWTKFVKETIHNALENKKLVVLAGISFMAVFREAFEVVLFLRAIWNDVEASGQNAMIAGIVAAFVLIFGFSYFALKYSQKIPVKRLFSISSMVMAVLSITLVGKAVHSFQEAGLISATSLPLNLRFDLLGIYSTYQTILSQFVILAFLYYLWHIGAKSEAAVRTTETAPRL
jgi:high-affinity iron transporter